MRKPTALKVAIAQWGGRQKDLATQIGLSEPTLSRIVNGLHADDATREKIAAALGRTTHELWPDQIRDAA